MNIKIVALFLCIFGVPFYGFALEEEDITDNSMSRNGHDIIMVKHLHLNYVPNLNGEGTAANAQICLPEYMKFDNKYFYYVRSFILIKETGRMIIDLNKLTWSDVRRFNYLGKANSPYEPSFDLISASGDLFLTVTAPEKIKRPTK